jgi:CubicO group peptidase (beta-lactamase class C family)
LLATGAAGLSMALIDKSGVRWSGARGYADLAHQKPMTADTVLNIASISKTVTGTSLMMLVERGKLDLDRDVNDYLPFKVTHPWKPETVITARQLLTHTSAIIDRSAIYDSETVYFPGADNPVALGEFVREYLSPGGRYYDRENFAAYPPGAQFSYSNVAYGLAGYLVEAVSGEPLNRFSRDEIFKPLGMDATGWMLSEIDTGRHAKLYEWNGQENTLAGWYGLATWPDGGLRTSVNDLGRFYAAMMNGGELNGVRILQEATVTAMFQPQFESGQALEAVPEEENRKQAISWVYRISQDGNTVAGHSGGDPGVATHAYFSPASGTGALLLVNTSSVSGDFGVAIRDMVRALLTEASKTKDNK